MPAALSTEISDQPEPAFVQEPLGLLGPPPPKPRRRRTSEHDPGQVIVLAGRNVVVADPAMKAVYARIQQLAATDYSVLIGGETGTGKELAALALHGWSRRAQGPFIAINCAALPEGLAESELFGHARGAFSGAVADKQGLLETGGGGTVFLDEIGDLPIKLQAKLLRALEMRAIMRLGSVEERKIDIRIVAATHRRLEAAVRGGRFRQDLFFRLNHSFLMLPPLRERVRELILLANQFLREARQREGRSPLALNHYAIEGLLAHPWPGNVRELKNVMDYLAVVHGDEPIGGKELSAVLNGVTATGDPAPGPDRTEGAPGASRTLAERSQQHERDRLQTALLATGGHKTRAAALLNLPLSTLLAKLKRHGIT